jgi:hypothetical protein
MDFIAAALTHFKVFLLKSFKRTLGYSNLAFFSKPFFHK